MATVWAFDTETHLIEAGVQAPRLVCIQCASVEVPARILPAHEPEARQWLLDRLNSDDTLVGVSVSFDAAVCMAAWPETIPLWFRAYDEGRVIDLAIVAKVWDVAERGKLEHSYSMQTMMQRYINLQIEKENTYRLRYSELDGVALDKWPKEAVEYALADAEYTLALWENFRGGDEPATLTHQCKSDFALRLATAWGLAVDKPRVQATKVALEAELAGFAESLREAGILSAKGSVSQGPVTDLVIRHYRRRGQKAPQTPKGAISTSAETLREAAMTQPVLRTLLDYRGAQKLLTTYVKALLEAGDSCHPRYHVMVESGRTSSSGPNVQNLPTRGGIRECFKARDGCVFVAADYGQAELVCLAQITSMDHPPSRMAQALRDGQDLHLLTAAKILSIDYEQAVQRYDAGDPTLKDVRKLAKALNFGIPGGLGVGTLRALLASYGIEVSWDRATELKGLWLDLYPEVGLYFSAIGALGRDFSITHPVSGFKRAGMTFCAGANFGFQHLCAYGAKEAVFAVQRACFDADSPLYGSRLVAFIHDEIIIESPESSAREAAAALTEIMVREFATKATPDVPITAEAHMMRRWYKDAQPVYDADGGLVPWEPTTA